MCIRDSIHVVHTTPFVGQPSDIAKPVPERPARVKTIHGEEQVVDKILKHRTRGRGYQFLTLMKGAPSHDSEWQPTRDFVDEDGTVTDVWKRYIRETIYFHNIIDEDVNKGEVELCNNTV